MEGTGVPLVTPFAEDGSVDEANLRELVGWVVDAGVDFVVPCGSNGESELLTAEERARVTEVVVDASSVPVLAGTGHPGLVETRRQTDLAAEAGADAALVVTPFYYSPGQEAFEAYYRRLADESAIPIYLYSVPAKTGEHLEPETVGALSGHWNVHGMKDSAGDVVRLIREGRLAVEDFDLFVGSGSLYAQGLDVGTAGGILALANVVPELASEVYRRHRGGDVDGARALNADLVELNRAVTARYGVPGVKAAMDYRGVPSGALRSPLLPLGDDARREVEALVDGALDG